MNTYQNYDLYAQKDLMDKIHAVSGTLARMGNRDRDQNSKPIGWNDDRPKTRDAKKEQKIAIATSIASAAMIAVASAATSPILALFAGGVGMVNYIHFKNSTYAYKLAKIDGLLSKEDANQLMNLVVANKKMAAKLEPYKGSQIRDIPDNLKNQSYALIMAQYKTMAKLTEALDKAKATV